MSAFKIRAIMINYVNTRTEAEACHRVLMSCWSVIWFQ